MNECHVTNQAFQLVSVLLAYQAAVSCLAKRIDTVEIGGSAIHSVSEKRRRIEGRSLQKEK